MLDWSRCPATERVPGKVSGAWVFKGTRVPVKALFDNLEDDARVDDFLEWFSGVSREQVEAVLEFAGQSLMGCSPKRITDASAANSSDASSNGPLR